MKIFTKLNFAGIILCLFLLPQNITAQPPWGIFNMANSDIPSDDVPAVQIDSNGDVWAATDGGLAKFDGTTWTIFNSSNSDMPADWVQSIDVVSPTEIWIGLVSNTHGLCKYNGSTIIAYDTINGQPVPESVYAIKKDDNGNVWLGTGSLRSYKYDGTNLIDLGINGPNDIRAWRYHNGVLWGSSPYYGIYKYENATWTHYNMANSDIPSDNMGALDIDNNGIVWMGGIDPNEQTAGLTKFDGTTFTTYNSSNSTLPINTIVNIDIDAQNYLFLSCWNGTGIGSVTKFDGTAFTNVGTAFPVGTYVTDIDFDSDGDRRVWGSLNKGLYIQNVVTGIKEFIPPINVKSYPNPAVDNITIEVEAKDLSEKLSLSILNAQGQIVKQVPVSATISTIQLDGLASGFYFYQLKNATQILKTEKIIIK